MPSYVTGPRPRRETVFLNANNLPRKILPWKLITLREADLNDLCPKESFAFRREQDFQRERRDQPIGTYLPFYLFVFLFSFFFSFFLNTCFRFVIFSSRFLLPPPAMHSKGPLYSACYDWFLLFQPLTAFVWFGCPCRPPLVCQLLSQHHLPVLTVPLPITRQRRLFCLFVRRGTLTCYGVGALFLSIPHGMHLVIPTHPYFFWVVCHPSKTSPPKEPEQEPQNRFSPLPSARPCPLTSNP